MMTSAQPEYTRKDFTTKQDVKWCMGCGDYAVLHALRGALSRIGRKREDIVVVSGIGCSSRLPYYVNSYGLHSIHGRAPAMASGLKVHNPNLSVWIITGDGDALSIGGNHFIHLLRRNIKVNIILCNNEIYGLTKGQYSPTSKKGTVTKTSPFGCLDRSFQPAALAVGVGATFVANCMDVDTKHMEEVFIQAEKHQGTSFIQVFESCVIFNPQAHKAFCAPDKKPDSLVYAEEGKPLIFGSKKEKGISWENNRPVICDAGTDSQNPARKPIIHSSGDKNIGSMLANLQFPEFPIPLGILYQSSEPVYDQEVSKQLADIQAKKGVGNMEDLFMSGDTWRVE